MTYFGISLDLSLKSYRTKQMGGERPFLPALHEGTVVVLKPLQMYKSANLGYVLTFRCMSWQHMSISCARLWLS